jgi:hypothetical protein
MSLRQVVKLVLFLIQTPELPQEEDTSKEGQHGENTIVPDQERVAGKRVECLSNSSGDGVSEQRDGLDERTHVARRLRVRVFERCDGGEDLRECYKHVAAGLSPDIDGCWVDGSVLVEAVVCLRAAGGGLVDVVLNKSRPDHSGSCQPKSCSNLLDGGELPSHFSETGVEELIAKWDEEDECEGVEVIDDVVRHAIQGHGAGLIGEIVGQLAVSKPVERIPAEDGTGGETTADFINPGVIECHPMWAALGSNVRGFHCFP